MFDPNELPLTALSRIAFYLKDDSPFRDKVDVALDGVMLKTAGCTWKSLACFVVEIVDPSVKDGKLTSVVTRNLYLKKNKDIKADLAKSLWGLTDADLENLIFKIKKGKKFYKFQDVKKFSSIKFSNNYENLIAFKNLKQKERYKNLQNTFDKYRITIQLDSKLCNYYIKFGKGDPENIAKVIKENEFYHIYTNYLFELEKFMVNCYCEFGYYDVIQITLLAKQNALKDFMKINSSNQNLIPLSLRKFL